MGKGKFSSMPLNCMRGINEDLVNFAFYENGNTLIVCQYHFSRYIIKSLNNLQADYLQFS